MIPLFKPKYNKAKILAGLSDVFDSGWTGLGSKTKEFEAKFAEFVKADYSVFLNSCTSALHLALVCLDLPPGSKVIVPDITFVSTASAVLQAGHMPVLAPCDEKLQIDLDFVEQHADYAQAVIPVHYSGNCCDIERLRAICDKHDLFMIEDCAHATGSSYAGRSLGSFGDMACFSFHAVKNLSIGDGGAIVGKDKYKAMLCKKRWLSIDKSTYERSGKVYSYSYDIDDLGFKYHGNDVMATIALGNLETLPAENARRKEIFLKYEELLGKMLVHPNDKVDSSHHIICCKIHDRDRFIDYMAANSITVGVHYKPVSSFSYYARYADGNTIARGIQAFQNICSLPCFPDLTDDEIEYVISKVRAYV